VGSERGAEAPLFHREFGVDGLCEGLGFGDCDAGLAAGAGLFVDYDFYVAV
jgi:hypothetical protein